MKKIAIVMQGPVHEDLDGFATVDILKFLCASELRHRFFVVCAVWEDELQTSVDVLARYADKVVLCPKPARAGAGNNNYQRQGVSCGLRAIEHLNFEYVLKTRSDIMLSETFLRGIVELADGGFKKVLATHLVTTLESFHISDFILFSTFENIAYWFDTREVYYEDVYSPEVQFTRTFIRNKGLNYTLRLEDYFTFLRDWIDYRDFDKEGLMWAKRFKSKIVARQHARLNPHIYGDDLDAATGKVEREYAESRHNSFTPEWYTGIKRKLPLKMDKLLTKLFFSRQMFFYDRDCGPILSRLMSIRLYRFLTTTRISTSFIAALIISSDAMASFALRKFPPFKHRYYLYSVDPQTSEHAKPVGANAVQSFIPARRTLNAHEDCTLDSRIATTTRRTEKPENESQVA